ncbi:hypothetical protein [Fervidicola ferrireducens]|uniref:hypothetical protein n=1 Tax=Fervidicola ferrireducens TaxID=520764 RepID=UPI001CA464F5|nr:hypothetical protein [Fervidicola ferrireducens]
MEKMARMLETYRKACAWFLEQAETLNTTSRAKLNRETYRRACELFDLNRATLQCAMLKALSAYRSYLSRTKNGKKSSLPKFDSIQYISCRQAHGSLSFPSPPAGVR